MIEKMSQSFEIENQTFQVDWDFLLGFGLSLSSVESGNNHYQTLINSMTIDVTHAKGNVKPNLAPIIGQSFDLTLAPSGQRIDLGRADSIFFEVEEGDQQSLGSKFKSIFPQLSSEPVLIGASWTYVDTLRDQIAHGESNIIRKTTCNFEGYEIRAGEECAKILTETIGTFNTTKSKGDMEVRSMGHLNVHGTCYFDYKSGRLIENNSEGNATGIFKITNNQEKTIIPFKRGLTVKIRHIR